MNLRTIEEYRDMMADPVRMRAYQSAIRTHCPGVVVCEIGVGLGPLSLMALEAGATRVYGIEALEPVLDTATAIIREAGYGPDRFVPISGLSWDVELPERVDVVISETLDSVGLGENTVATMSDAARRFLAPGGVLVPHQLTCAIALAAPASFESRIRFWRDELEQQWGLDYRALGEALVRVDHTLPVEPDELFSAWKTWQDVDLANARTLQAQTLVAVPVTRPGRVTGFVTAFEATVGETTLGTFPGQADTHWKQGFLPLPSPHDVEAGDIVGLHLTVPDERALTVSMRRRVVHVPAEEASQYRSPHLPTGS